VQTAQDANITLCFSLLPVEVSRCSVFEKGFWDRIGLGELGIRFQLQAVLLLPSSQEVIMVFIFQSTFGALNAASFWCVSLEAPQQML